MTVEAEFPVDHGTEEVDVSDQVLVKELLNEVVSFTLGIDRERDD